MESGMESIKSAVNAYQTVQVDAAVLGASPHELIAKLLAKVLHKKPHKRFDNATEFLEALQEAIKKYANPSSKEDLVKFKKTS